MLLLILITSYGILIASTEKDQLLEKTARHQNLDCLTPFEQMSKKWKLLKNKKTSFQADASLRPKWTTAWIATARQKHWKMSTAQIIKNWKSGSCTALKTFFFFIHWSKNWTIGPIFGPMDEKNKKNLVFFKLGR
jgi:hypothetical protein